MLATGPTGMPGKFTRLLSAAEEDHLSGEVPTFRAQAWDLAVDNYLPYNKPFAMCCLGSTV